MPFDYTKIWNILTPVKNLIPIYQETMSEKISSIPDSYAVIENSTYDNTAEFGDGQELYRRVEFNIRIHSNDSLKINNVTQSYMNEFRKHQIRLTKYGPTLDPSNGRYSCQLTGEYLYEI